MKRIAWSKAKNIYNNTASLETPFRIQNIPNVWRPGKVDVWVCSKSNNVDDWMRMHDVLSNEKVVGVDIEWRPSWSEKQSKTALLQLSKATSALLFQMIYADKLPDSIHELIASTKIIKTGFGVLEDLKKLNTDYGLSYGALVDVGYLARRLVKSPTRGMAKTSKFICGIEIPKPKHIQMGNWEARELSLEQIRYAAHDALIGRHVYDHLCKVCQREDLLCRKDEFLYEQYYSSVVGSNNNEAVTGDDACIQPTGTDRTSMCGREIIRKKAASIREESSTSTKAFFDFLNESDDAWFADAANTNSDGIWTNVRLVIRLLVSFIDMY